MGDINGDGKDDAIGFDTGSSPPGPPFFLYAINSSGIQLWDYQIPPVGADPEEADHIKIGDVNGGWRE